MQMGHGDPGKLGNPLKVSLKEWQNDIEGMIPSGWSSKADPGNGMNTSRLTLKNKKAKIEQSDDNYYRWIMCKEKMRNKAITFYHLNICSICLLLLSIATLSWHYLLSFSFMHKDFSGCSSWPHSFQWGRSFPIMVFFSVSFVSPA